MDRFFCQLTLAFFLWHLSAPTIAQDGFSVRQEGNNLELVTPWGNKILYGDLGMGNSPNMRMEIPLDELRPPGWQPPPAPKKEEEEKEEKEERPQPVVVAPPPPPPPPPPVQQPILPPPPPPPPPHEEAHACVPSAPTEYDDSDRLVLEANRLFNRGKYYEATLYVDELLRKKPNYVRGWIMKGSLMYIQGQKDLARKAWLRAQSIAPDDGQVASALERYK